MPKHQGIIARTCQNPKCGKTFFKAASRLKWCVGKYCSKECKPLGGAVPAEERFWAKVDKTPGHGPNGDCWFWTGTKSNGYGMFHRGGKRGMVQAYRYSWELHNGPIPEGLNVCHKCDFPPCVNWDHAFLGTDLDNIRDCANKGRLNSVKGEDHPAARLSIHDVELIRQLATQGLKPSKIRPLLPIVVDDSTIADVIARRTWKHVH